MKLFSAIYDLLVIHGQCDAFQLSQYTGRNIEDIVQELLRNRNYYNIGKGHINGLDDVTASRELEREGKYLGHHYEYDFDDVLFPNGPRWFVHHDAAKDRIGPYWDDITIPVFDRHIKAMVPTIEIIHKDLLIGLGFVFDTSGLDLIQAVWKP
jgi:hypothetical protein